MIPVRGASKGVPRKKTRGIIEVAGRRVGPGHPCLLIADLVGRRLARRLAADTLLAEEDLVS